jgi:hypothetical protein
MVPGAEPAGQASGMTAPARMVGTRMSSVMCCSTAATLAISSASSGAMFSRWASAPAARSVAAGAGRCRSTAARISASPAPVRRACSAAAIAAPNQPPGL